MYTLILNIRVDRWPNTAHDAEKGGPLWLIDHAHRGGVTALQLAQSTGFVMTGGGGRRAVWELR